MNEWINAYDKLGWGAEYWEREREVAKKENAEKINKDKSWRLM